LRRRVAALHRDRLRETVEAGWAAAALLHLGFSLLGGGFLAAESQ